MHGVIVYEIIESAGKLVLNGMYANTGNGGKNDKPYELNNEFAIKIDGNSSDILVGNYEARYIDTHLVDCHLEIQHENEVYKLVWIVNGSSKFIGLGIRSGNHLSVSYIHA